MTTKERITTIGHDSRVTIALMLVLVGGAFWLGTVSEEVRGLSSTQREHARLIAEASTTLAAVQARLESK